MKVQWGRIFTIQVYVWHRYVAQNHCSVYCSYTHNYVASGICTYLYLHYLVASIPVSTQKSLFRRCSILLQRKDGIKQ